MLNTWRDWGGGGDASPVILKANFSSVLIGDLWWNLKTICAAEVATNAATCKVTYLLYYFSGPFFFFLRLYGLFWGTPGCTVGDHETRVSIMQGSTKSMFLSSGLQNSLVRNWRRKMCFYVNNETEFICAEIGKALHSPDRQILKRSLDLLPLANSKPTCYHLNHWICHFAKTRIQYIRT